MFALSGHCPDNIGPRMGFVSYGWVGGFFESFADDDATFTGKQIPECLANPQKSTRGTPVAQCPKCGSYKTEKQ